MKCTSNSEIYLIFWPEIQGWNEDTWVRRTCSPLIPKHLAAVCDHITGVVHGCASLLAPERVVCLFFLCLCDISNHCVEGALKLRIDVVPETIIILNILNER